MTSLLTTAMILVTALTTVPATPRPKPTGVEAEIYALHQKFSETWNRHDAAGLAAMWTEHGDYVEPDGRATFTRGDVQKLFGFEHGSVFKDSQLTLVVEHVRFVTDNVAVTDGSYELFGARDPTGNPIPTRSGYFTTVLQKKDKEWMVSAARLMLPQVLIWREKE